MIYHKVVSVRAIAFIDVEGGFASSPPPQTAFK